MLETKRAEIVNDASGQLIRMPREFQLQGDEVYVTRDSSTGELTLAQP